MSTNQSLSDLSINKLTPNDVEEIVSIIRANLDPFEEAGSVLAAAYRRLKNFWQTYSSEGAGYWVVRDLQSNKIIGGAGLGPFAGLSPEEKIGEIRELVIQPEFRGRGAGKSILDHCLKFARDQGYHRIYLETTPQMEPAQQLFLRSKFRPVVMKSEDGQTDTEALPCYFMLDYQNGEADD